MATFNLEFELESIAIRLKLIAEALKAIRLQEEEAARAEDRATAELQRMGEK